jgi:lysophospholipase L1-like esterase
MPKEKIKIKIEFKITLLIVLVATLVAFWSAWFGRYHAETGMQQVATILRDGQMKSSADELVFLGDSLTAREDWNVLFGVNNIFNAGRPGDTTDDVLARLDLVPTTSPQKVFLMIGINDLLRGKDVPYVLANYYKIIDRIKLKYPSAQIYIQSVLPINSDISQIGIINSKKIIDLNSRLDALVDGKKIFFLNLYPDFHGLDNQMYAKYTNDGVHLNASGYAAWKNSVAAYIK